MTDKELLISLYQKTSKHSNYQVLPGVLRDIVGAEEVTTKTRSEAERFRYVSTKLDFIDKTVIDIGGNTGYFTFEALDLGAKEVTHVEGNKEHSEFVALASKVLGFGEKVKTINQYYDFSGDGKRFDVGLLFNVLHHVGDDYGNVNDIEDAKSTIAKQLNNMAKVVDTLVFQMGFNWMGDPQKPLFPGGTKREVIDYVNGVASECWEITAVGTAVGTRTDVRYEDITEINIERSDELGEFLNRPIFILKSRTGSVNGQ